MFGFSLSELIVVIVVALVVIGPKDLPKMLRKLGQWAGKLRRMASELRAQSGIDDALRTEGLADDINEIRKLARGELDDIKKNASVDVASVSSTTEYGGSSIDKYSDDTYVHRDREYPRDGADAYGALPDNAIVYAEGMPKSKLGRDPLYVLGDANGELPQEPTMDVIEPEPINQDLIETADPGPVARDDDSPSDAAAVATGPASEAH